MERGGGSGQSSSGDGAPGREAWKELYEHVDTRTGNEAPRVYVEGEPPVAMQAEEFDKDGVVRLRQRGQELVEERKGCWFMFWNGIRRLWGTRETEDVMYNRDMYVKLSLREWIVYMLFLIDLSIPFGMTNTNAYYFTRALSTLFLDESFGSHGRTFHNMDEMDDFWEYVKGPLLKGVHWEEWRANRNNGSAYIYYENILMGLPRLRMLRVKPNTCTVPAPFQRQITECYGSYSDSNEDKAQFGPANADAWTYKTRSDLGGMAYWGLLSTYGGGGFTQSLGHTYNESISIINNLQQNMWIDRASRVVFIDFTLYNANLNLFCSVKLVMELPSMGGLVSSWSLRTVKLIRYVTLLDYVIRGLEGLFCVFVLYYIIEEIIEISKHRCQYFYSFWNISDIIIIVLALCCIAFSIYREMVIDSVLPSLINKSDSFPNFDWLTFAQARFDDALAIMLFFAWIKVVKYASLTESTYRISLTLSHCAEEVAGFVLLFVLFFLAFVQLGYLLFGAQLQEFCTFQGTIFSLVCIILGDFKYDSLERVNGVLGPIFLITYVFFVFFILLNVSLAIINNAYAEVKSELAREKYGYGLVDYLGRVLKMRFKREQLEDVQHWLEWTGNSPDRVVDFYEWKAQLKRRGGNTEREIERMFARYALDDDRVNTDALPIQNQNAYKGGPVEPAGQEFSLLSRRVDRLEQSIDSVLQKMDAVLAKLESVRMTRRHEATPGPRSQDPSPQHSPANGQIF